LRLVCLSFLLLFVELALIRWTGENVVYLSYFSNFVLLGSFLGIGVGFLRSRRRLRLFPLAPVALALLIAFVHLYHVQIDRSGNRLIYFGRFQATGLPIWATLPVVFVCSAVIMALSGSTGQGATDYTLTRLADGASVTFQASGVLTAAVRLR